MITKPTPIKVNLYYFLDLSNYIKEKCKEKNIKLPEYFSLIDILQLAIEEIMNDTIYSFDFSDVLEENLEDYQKEIVEMLVELEGQNSIYIQVSW